MLLLQYIYIYENKVIAKDNTSKISNHLNIVMVGNGSHFSFDVHYHGNMWGFECWWSVSKAHINGLQWQQYVSMCKSQCDYTYEKEDVIPFFKGIHCSLHWTNLVVLSLSKLSLVIHLEAFLQVFYEFSFYSPSKILNFKGNNVLT